MKTPDTFLVVNTRDMSSDQREVRRIVLGN